MLYFQLSSKDSHLPTSTGDGIKKPFLRGLNKKFEPTSARMSSPAPAPTTETNVLLRQNQELRHRLHEEASNYRRRLDTYKQSQQNQAQLVNRLQSKVMQYKQRCSELEGQMHETILPISNYSLPRGQPCSSSSPPPPIIPPSCQTTGSSAPMSLPCPGSNEQHQSHSQHPIREYRDRDECLSDDTAKRLEEERVRYVLKP